MVTERAEGRLPGVRGLSLLWRRWAVNEPLARVLLIHGYGEHSARYEHVATALGTAGYEVVALDHRGHGRSDGKAIAVVRFQDYIDDIQRLVDHAAAEWGERTTVMLGHSLGGLMATTYALQHQAELAGLILSAPAVMPPKNVSALTIRVAKVLARVTPNLGTVGLPVHLVSRDPEVVAAYNADPLVHRGKVRARLGAEIIHAVDAVQRDVGRLTLPLLLLQGGADGLVDSGAARWVSEHCGSSDHELREYPELFHEIFNEPERDQVIADVVDWLGRHVPADRQAEASAAG